MNVIHKLFVLAVLLVLTTSCAPMQMYPGQRLPRDQVARIKQFSTTHVGLFYGKQLMIVSWMV